MKKALFYFAILILALSLALQADDSKEIKKQFSTTPGKTVSIQFSDSDGDVIIESHNKNEISVVFIKEYKGSQGSRSHDYFRSITPEFTYNDNRLVMEVKYPKRLFTFSGYSLRVRTKILTPAKTDINIRLSDGDARLTELNGRLETVCSDGDLEILGCSGDMKLKTSDGDIVVKGGKGKLVLQSSDGDIHADGVFHAFDITTSDGDCILNLLPGSELNAESRIKTSDGDIRFEYPAGFSFAVTAQTSDGDIVSNARFDSVTLKKENRLEARVGKADYALSLLTSDGDIRISNK